MRRPPGGRTYAGIVRANVLTLFNLILAAFAVLTLAFGDWRDGFFLVILVVNTTIGIAQEVRAKRAVDRLAALVAPAEAIVVCAQIEAELASLEADDLAEMLESYGLAERGLDRVVASGFATLGLQTYLTAGPMEARAWTITVGDTAPKAAGVIHTDFERGFIKAEIVSFADLIETGSMAAAKAAGKVRLEGKDYVMSDGDVVEFRFNV